MNIQRASYSNSIPKIIGNITAVGLVAAIATFIVVGMIVPEWKAHQEHRDIVAQYQQRAIRYEARLSAFEKLQADHDLHLTTLTRFAQPSAEQSEVDLTAFLRTHGLVVSFEQTEQPVLIEGFQKVSRRIDFTGAYSDFVKMLNVFGEAFPNHNFKDIVLEQDFSRDDNAGAKQLSERVAVHVTATIVGLEEIGN